MGVVCFRNVACFGWYGIDQDHECLCIYICTYVFKDMYSTYISLHAGCPHSRQCDQWENAPDKMSSSPLLYCPSITPNNLSLYASLWQTPSPPSSTPCSALPPLLCPLPPFLSFFHPDCAVWRWSRGNSMIRLTPWWTWQRYVRLPQTPKSRGGE